MKTLSKMLSLAALAGALSLGAANAHADTVTVNRTAYPHRTVTTRVVSTPSGHRVVRRVDYHPARYGTPVYGHGWHRHWENNHWQWRRWNERGHWEYR
jgi:hypothetical protein